MKMKSLLAALGMGFALCAVGCSSDSDGSPSSGTLDTKDCDAVGARYKSLSNAAGCTDDSAMLITNCKALFAAKVCTDEFEALVGCIAPKPASDFTCDSDDSLELKTDACKTQQDALDACIG